jgi:DNA-binding NtrC family response regulator
VSAAPDDAVEVETWHLPPAITRRARRDEAEAASAAAGEVAADGGGAAGAGGGAATDAEDGGGRAAGASFRPIADEVRELERRRMVEALRATGGVQNRAAELIEMPLRTFATKLKRYRIQAADWAG